MVTSLGLIFILGIALSLLCKKFNIPELVGMIVAGIIIGPYCLDWLSIEILDISPNLREIALVIILTRAGLSLDIRELKTVGRPALLLCFVPALFEIVGITYLAPKLFNISSLEGFLLGCVVAAVSPAIIVPRMLNLKDKGYGTKKNIPGMITLAASIDDILVIILFTSTVTLLEAGNFSTSTLLDLPISVGLALLVGWLSSILYCFIVHYFKCSDSQKVLSLLSMFFLFLYLEDFLVGKISFSGLFAIMCCAIFINYYTPKSATRLAASFNKLWDGAQIWLFVLVGASLQFTNIGSTLFLSLIAVMFGLVFRIAGVFTSLIDTPFDNKEKLFISYSYLPKATVQAAIGGIPLSLGLACGELVQSVSIMAILFTAPLGAYLMDNNYDKLLRRMK